MRSQPDSGRCILFRYIGKQKQHQQSATARGDVHPPGGEIMTLVRIAIVRGKADIDMPAGIAGVVRVREANREGPKVRPWTPAPGSDELVKSHVEHGTVHHLPEWFVTVVTEPNHGPGPARRIIRVAWQIAP